MTDKTACDELRAELESKTRALAEREAECERLQLLSDDTTKALRKIAEVWEAEHGQGGSEPETALTCMLQALHMLREQKRGMADGFNTLIGERDTLRAQLAASEAERERLVGLLHASMEKGGRIVEAFREHVTACEPVVEAVRELRNMTGNPKYQDALRNVLFYVELPAKVTT